MNTKRLLVSFSIAVALFSGYSAEAETPILTPVMSSKFVPDDAIAVVSVSPAELLRKPILEWFPTEVFRVQSKEQFGFDPADVLSLRAVAGLSEQGELRFGAIAELTGDVDLERLLVGLGGSSNRMKDGERLVHSLDRMPGRVFIQVDAKTIFVGLLSYAEPMLAANDGTGPLPSLLATMPQRSGVNAAISLESIRSMVSGYAMGFSGALAPSLRPLAEIPGLTDAVKIHVDLEGQSASLELSFVGIDESAAARIESVLNESLVAARELAMAEVVRSSDEARQTDAMRQAIEVYANRLGEKLVATLKPSRENDEVTITADAAIGAAGALAGLLMPSMQSARTAARRMSTANNFKQVMLAMHNYHASYNRLPTSAITDADGKPLLSWRVAILPFVEEQELYQQFHLDEPWDSEHNLPLSKKLPRAFESLGTQLRDGETVIHAIVGDEIGMKPLKETRFRDFLDGLSNTLLIVEVNPDSAVIWSKPTDADINLENPLANLRGTPDNGFHVGLGDGSVRFMPDTIDPELLKALMTRAGKEVIGNW